MFCYFEIATIINYTNYKNLQPLSRRLRKSTPSIELRTRNRFSTGFSTGTGGNNTGGVTGIGTGAGAGVHVDLSPSPPSSSL